jgi:hypothetical protein
VHAADSPATVSSADIPRLFDVPTAQRTVPQRKLEELDATHRRTAARDGAAGNSTPTNPYVFVVAILAITARKHRDNSWRSGAARTKTFEKGSGRLELAQRSPVATIP